MFFLNYSELLIKVMWGIPLSLQQAIHWLLTDNFYYHLVVVGGITVSLARDPKEQEMLSQCSPGELLRQNAG